VSGTQEVVRTCAEGMILSVHGETLGGKGQLCAGHGVERKQSLSPGPLLRPML
jgi:hypothetical protein